jgi:hypothetical protein
VNSELSKTISTCTIWLAVTCILTFGIFKMAVNGDMAVFLLFFCLPAGVIYGAVQATKVVWGSRCQDKAPADPATALHPAQSASPTAKN